jgi:transcriptional regulator of aromatic amino acid metabolism
VKSIYYLRDLLTVYRDVDILKGVKEGAIMAKGPTSQRPDKDLLIQLYRKHGTTRAVARALGLNESSVYRYRKYYGLAVKRDLTQER